MGFQQVLDEWTEERILARMAAATPAAVERAIASESRTPEDLAALLSPHAEARLEEMARVAHRLTRQHFGRTIGLYAPLYLSNVCASDCLYCGYAARAKGNKTRRTLGEAEIRSECQALAAQGFQNILLLTGEAPRVAPVEYLARAVTLAREYFSSVSVEIYALDEPGYARLVECGLEGVTLYMETYNRATYEAVHLVGVKRDYGYRLGAIERAGRAGARRLSIGALLGLHDWRTDAFLAALHARYLQKACWRSAISISFPRLRHAADRYVVRHMPDDRRFVQLMLATRLFLPEVGFNLSTREPAELRDRLIPLGVTMMSAGSSTRPGGYATSGPDTLEQFEVEDRRTPREVVEAIRSANYDPVWKDFDRAYLAHG